MASEEKITHRQTLADRVVSWFNPVSGVKRTQARQVLAYYEAAKSDRVRKNRREGGSGNVAVARAGASLWQQARHFEQNYDLALGVLNTLVNNVVGASGIGIEPQPRKMDGSIDDVLARQIMVLWKDWCTHPEVTGYNDWGSAQRLLCRSWLRDGEVFAQKLVGPVDYLVHGTKVPFSLELLECDFVPMSMYSTSPTILQGIQINGWGAPVAYHVYKSSPIEVIGSMASAGQTKPIAAANMLHLANIHRIRQLRGVSVFASVLNRFDDLKDYEESERIAAKIAASMAAFIRKGAPDTYNPADAPNGKRSLRFAPGMVFDDLLPGEEIGTIDTNRPNPNLETYRSGQLKAVAAGAGPTFSSIARTYDGTYSAQRQELVEGWSTYGVLSAEFISRIVRPVYETFIAAAIASGQLRIPSGVVRDSVDDAQYLAQQMPWIDPVKEAEGWRTLTRSGFASEPEVIRRRGGVPADTLEQIATFRRLAAERELIFDSNAAVSTSASAANAHPTDPANPQG